MRENAIGGPVAPTPRRPVAPSPRCPVSPGARLSVWIDDRHAFADELTQDEPGELFLIEVYDRGRTMRADTTWWVAAMARKPLMPVFY